MVRASFLYIFALSIVALAFVVHHPAQAQTLRVVKASAFKYPNATGLSGSVEFAVTPAGSDSLDRYRIEVTRAVDQDGNPITFMPGPKEFKVARGMGEIRMGVSFSDSTGKLRSFRELVAELVVYSPSKAPESSLRVDRIPEKLGTTVQLPGVDDVTVQLLTIDDFVKTLSAKERKSTEQMMSQGERNGFAVQMHDPSGRVVSYRYDNALGSGGSGGFYGELARRLFYSSRPLSPNASLTFLVYNPKAETRLPKTFTDIPVDIIDLGLVKGP